MRFDVCRPTILLTVAALTVPAHAQARGAAGLYAPFPSLTTKGHLRGYLADFGVRVPVSKLRSGATIGSTLRPSAAARSREVSRRIEPGRVGGAPLAWLLAGTLAACAAVTVAYLRRPA